MSVLMGCADCGGPRSNRGSLCWECHQRRHTSRESQLRRFWLHVKPAKADECWEWTAARNQAGYGRTLVDGRHVNASRAVFLLAGLAIADGLHVCHTCDNPPCVNPAHLYVGTASQNELDKYERGRGPKAKDRCQRGHSDYVTRANGLRVCRTCKRASDNAWYARQASR